MINVRTYRFESIVSEELMPNYFTEKKYVRTVEIHFLKKHKELYQYQILCTKFDFSDQDTASGFLLKKISYLFDEIELYANEENTIVKVNNLHFIKARWKVLQERYLKINKGDAVENYFRQISALLEDGEQFLKFLMGYNMFGLYFNGQSGSYPENGKKIRTTAEEKIEHLHKESVSDEKEIVKMKSPEKNTENKTGIEGFSIYENGFIKENYVCKKETNHQIKYSLLWVG